MCDFDEKFLVWKSSAKIYVESDYTREVRTYTVKSHFIIILYIVYNISQSITLL